MEAQDRSSGWIGAVLKDRWKIESKIARGGVATVFRARTRDGQLGAVKIMHPQYARNADVLARFLREGYTANKVGHPNVVRILEDGTAPDGSPFLVMELLEDGEPLEERRERLGGRLPLDEVARATDQLLDVLTAAHAQGIIHRDIKPENLFVLADGTLKVLDFGIAHIKEAALAHEATATGLLLGTPEFMSPEQALGRRGLVDAQSDVYAVGCTMFTLLSGEAVHLYDSLPLLLAAVATRQARSLSSVAFRGLPREMIAIVDKALVLDKPRRWLSARAMRDAMRAALPWAAEKARLVPSPPPRAHQQVSLRRPSASREPMAREELPNLTEHESDPTLTIATGERPVLDAPKPPSGRSWATTPADGARVPRLTPPPPPSRRPPAPRPASSRSSASPPSSGDTIAMPPPSMGGAPERTVIRPAVGHYDTMIDADGAPATGDRDPWTMPFDTSDMEGPTVALMAPPTSGSQSPITPRMPPEGDDQRTTNDVAIHYRPSPALFGPSMDPFAYQPHAEMTGPFMPMVPDGPMATQAPVFPAPHVDDRAATARFALVGLGIVVVLCLLAGAWLFLR